MPASINEHVRIEAWLASALTASAIPAGAAEVFEGAVPADRDVANIYVIFNQQSGVDVAGVSAIRLWVDDLYLVKVVGPATRMATLVAVADAVEGALQRAGEVVIGPNSDGYLMRCAREGAIPLPVEVVNTVKIKKLATLWRIYARAA